MNATVRRLAENIGLYPRVKSYAEQPELFYCSAEKLEAFAKSLLELAAKEAQEFPSAIDGRVPLEIAQAIRALLK